MALPPLSLSRRSQQTADSPISYFMQQAVENPDLISLAAGLVDEPSLPLEDLRAVASELLADPRMGRKALQYGTTQGLLGLRERVLRHICAADGVAPSELQLSPEDVVITSGSQQLLYLLTEVLLDPGDLVLTEAPSYFVFHGVLASHGVEVQSIPMDEQGMITDALEERLQRLARTGELARLKLIYTVDYFQNPSGRTLSLARRQHLLELVQEYSNRQRILILEDAAYRELRFEGPDLPSLKRFDERNQWVVSTYTFSKPCAPGLKTGYGFLPQDLVQAVNRFKGNHDFGSNNFAQMLLLRLMEEGRYERHVAHLQQVYRRKRDLMQSALEVAFGDLPGVSWTRPAGGLYIWLTLPESMSTRPGHPFAQAALREGVLYVPGAFGHVGNDDPVPDREVRLCYGVVAEQQLAEGIRRLRRAADHAGATVLVQ